MWNKIAAYRHMSEIAFWGVGVAWSSECTRSGEHINTCMCRILSTLQPKAFGVATCIARCIFHCRPNGECVRPQHRTHLAHCCIYCFKPTPNSVGRVRLNVEYIRHMPPLLGYHTTPLNAFGSMSNVFGICLHCCIPPTPPNVFGSMSNVFDICLHCIPPNSAECVRLRCRMHSA